MILCYCVLIVCCSVIIFVYWMLILYWWDPILDYCKAGLLQQALFSENVQVSILVCATELRCEFHGAMSDAILLGVDFQVNFQMDLWKNFQVNCQWSV